MRNTRWTRSPGSRGVIRNSTNNNKNLLKIPGLRSFYTVFTHRAASLPQFSPHRSQQRPKSQFNPRNPHEPKSKLIVNHAHPTSGVKTANTSPVSRVPNLFWGNFHPLAAVEAGGDAGDGAGQALVATSDEPRRSGQGLPRRRSDRVWENGGVLASWWLVHFGLGSLGEGI